MPAIITHNIFAKEIYQLMDEQTKKIVKPAYSHYVNFSQSFDNFSYYHIFSQKKNKMIKDLGKAGHRKNTQAYFINIIRNIINNNLIYDSECRAYLYGSINHYCLDSICHPYIFYKSGVWNKSDSSTVKYRGLHTKLEFNIDALLYEHKTEKNIIKYKFINDLVPKINFSNNLKTVIDQTFKQTFNKENISFYYNKSIKWARFLYKWGVYDRFGIKRKIYLVFDKLFPNKNSNAADISYYKKNISTEDLNLKKKIWYHPSDDSLKFTYSFLDLYDLAIQKSTMLIKEVNKILTGEQDIKKLSKTIKNVSYLTGLDITKNQQLKFFEF